MNTVLSMKSVLATTTLLLALSIHKSMCFTLSPTTARNILGGGAIHVRSTPTYHSKPIHYQQYSPSSSRMFIAETDAEDKDTSTSSIVEDSSESTEIVESTSTTSPWYKNIFKKKSKDDLSFKQKLAKMGMSVALSYGYVFLSHTLLSFLAYLFTHFKPITL